MNGTWGKPPACIPFQDGSKPEACATGSAPNKQKLPVNTKFRPTNPDFSISDFHHFSISQDLHVLLRSIPPRPSFRPEPHRGFGRDGEDVFDHHPGSAVARRSSPSRWPPPRSCATACGGASERRGSSSGAPAIKPIRHSSNFSQMEVRRKLKLPPWRNSMRPCPASMPRRFTRSTAFASGCSKTTRSKPGNRSGLNCSPTTRSCGGSWPGISGGSRWTATRTTFCGIARRSVTGSSAGFSGNLGGPVSGSVLPNPGIADRH